MKHACSLCDKELRQRPSYGNRVHQAREIEYFTNEQKTGLCLECQATVLEREKALSKPWDMFGDIDCIDCVNENCVDCMTKHTPRGCSDIEWMAIRGGHNYATWTCDKCGEEMCWGCAVRCTNNSTGEGEIICPHCRAYGGEYK